MEAEIAELYIFLSEIYTLDAEMSNGSGGGGKISLTNRPSMKEITTPQSANADSSPYTGEPFGENNKSQFIFPRVLQDASLRGASGSVHESALSAVHMIYL